jgi:hypothetical protein
MNFRQTAPEIHVWPQFAARLRYALGSSRSQFNCWSTWSCKR